MGRPLKILVVANFYPPMAVGGAELVAHRHALELVARGHEVAVFAGRPPRSDQVGGEMAFETLDGIPVHRLSIRSLEYARSFHWDAAGRRFRAVLEHFRPDVVHFHNLIGLGANLILEARRVGIATVCTVHDHWGFCALNTLYRPAGHVCDDFEECHFCVPNVADEKGTSLPFRLRRDYVHRCLSEVDHLVFPSRYLADVYAKAGFGTARTRVQSNGVDLDRFTAARSPGARMRIAVVGYLGEHKGFGLLLEAIDRMLAMPHLRGRWEIVIAGDGHLRGRIAKVADDPACRDHLSFLGKLRPDEIPALLASADVVLLPSLWPENEPVVMLEAIAAGAAQLASRIGGHRELVEDGRSGFLFESGNLDDLIEKLERYIEDPGLARAHGAFNWNRRGTFAQALAVDAYEDIYRSVRWRDEPGDPVVLCTGAWPSLGVAHLFNNLSVLEATTERLRFIYADWADSRLWEKATAMIVWSDDCDRSLLLRCVHAKIPVIAPLENAFAGSLRGQGHNVFSYGDLAEAVSALRSVVKPEVNAACRAPDEDLSATAAAIATLAGPDAFGLAAERPSV